MVNKRIVAQAKKLLQLSLDGGQELEASRVKEVCRAVATSTLSNRAALLKAFRSQVEMYEARRRAIITSADSLDGSARKQVEQSVREKFPQVTETTWQADPQLIGGVTVLVGDMWYDGSVRRDLRQVREQLGSL